MQTLRYKKTEDLSVLNFRNMNNEILFIRVREFYVNKIPQWELIIIYRNVCRAFDISYEFYH